MEAEGQPDEERDHYQMHGAGDEEGAGYAEFFWDGVEAGGLVEFNVLAGVENVEAADPERYGGAEDQHARGERASDGDPCGGGRDAESETEDEVGPGGETFCEGIEKKDSERDGGKF